MFMFQTKTFPANFLTLICSSPVLEFLKSNNFIILSLTTSLLNATSGSITASSSSSSDFSSHPTFIVDPSFFRSNSLTCCTSDSSTNVEDVAHFHHGLQLHQRVLHWRQDRKERSQGTSNVDRICHFSLVQSRDTTVHCVRLWSPTA